MSDPLAPIIDGRKRIRLDDFDPGDTRGFTKEEALKRTEALGEELAELTNLLAYAGEHGLLVVLQGRDASGKDGVVRKLLQYANVLNARVVPFKVPTDEDRAHDFLWRVHKQVPRKGEIALFNRSHYEDVIAVRVHDLVPKDVWKLRYDHINDFERLLHESGTIVVKFILHISPKEQYKRLLEREKDPRTAWKLSVSDWREIPLWKETTEAYEDAINKCSSKELPFHLVSADHKWFRTLAIMDRLVRTLRPYREQWHDKLKDMRRSALREIEALRKTLKPFNHEK